MPTYAVRCTKDYSLFTLSEENRQIDFRKHHKLEESMGKYGFLKCFPIAVIRDKTKWKIKDGQHRFAVAQKLVLPVWFVEASEDFDVADTAGGQVPWNAADYVNRFVRRGLRAYIELSEFCEAHKIGLTVGAKLLAGTITFTNIRERFYSGELVIKDRAWADMVASCYTGLCNLSSNVKNSRMLEACMYAARIQGFDVGRLLSTAEHCVDKLRPYSTCDAYLVMLEDVYNFQKKTRVPVKFAAEEAMRQRSAAPKNGKVKK